VAIDLDKVLGAELPDVPTAWDPDDIILYHLGLGAGNPPTDPNELEYTYEGNLKVLPTWAVIPTFASFAQIGSIPGLDINFALVLHGEQDTEVFAPVPPQAKVTNIGRVANVWDKGKAAVVDLEIDTVDDEGNKLFTNRMSLFARGEGGFGGDPGPSMSVDLPDREPDYVIASPTLPQQALLYRLSGDKNPLHADPAFAKLGGFDTPILHGLCTYGVVAKAVVDHVFDGDVSVFGRFRTRFAGVVYPGETIVTNAWEDGDRVLLAVTTEERGAPVLSNAVIDRRA
jgi:acyl dehydratase